MTPSIKLLWILLPLTFRVRPNLPESVASTASALHLADPMLDDEPVLHAFRARKPNSDPDTLTFDEAMASPDRDLWIAVAEKEIADLTKRGTWREVPIRSATKKVLPGTWTFRLKRCPDGRPLKHKARYCVRGDLEETEEEHTSPVTSWSSVRVFLVFAMILGWVTCTIDFSNAFVQSVLPSDNPMWIRIPRGYRSTMTEGTCLKLEKSLYGTKIAPKLWFETAINAFKKLGFVQSKYDPCFLLRSDMLIVLYVGDAGLAAAGSW